MVVETIHLPHTRPDQPIHVALFKDVRNAAFLKQQLVSGNAAFEYALIDAHAIVSRTHALAAAFRALNDLHHDRLRSRNVHSEIVFALSPNNNIADSFRRFGLGNDTTALLVIKVSTTPGITHDSVRRHLGTAIEGTAVEFSDESLGAMTDVARVKKIYKFNDGEGGAGSSKAKVGVVTNGVDDEAATQRRELEVAILGMMALRGAS